MDAVDYAEFFTMFMLGVVTGLGITLKLLKPKPEDAEGEILEDAWECTGCGFTTSHEPMGQCPVCKFNGHTVPK